MAATPNPVATPVNLQDLKVEGLDNILESSCYRWLVADEIHSIMQRRSDFATNGKDLPPTVFTTGLYFYEGFRVPDYDWDLIVEQGNQMNHDSGTIHFTTIEAPAVNGGAFERRVYRCRPVYDMLSLVHFRKIRNF